MIDPAEIHPPLPTRDKLSTFFILVLTSTLPPVASWAGESSALVIDIKCASNQWMNVSTMLTVLPARESRWTATSQPL